MKERIVKVGNREIGDNRPTFIIAEIGINHNGSVELAKKMISGAVAAGADCVKFQKKDSGNLHSKRPMAFGT